MTEDADNLAMEKSSIDTNNSAAYKTEDAIRKNIDILLNSPPVSALSENAIIVDDYQGKNFVDKMYNYFVMNNQTKVPRGDWIVNISKSGIKSSKVKGLGAAKINAFAALPDIIQKGIIVDLNMNWKNRGYDSYIIDAPITIGSKEYIAEVIVNSGKDGNKNFYLHEVEEKSKLLDATQTGMDTGAPEGASKFRIAQLPNNVKQNCENNLLIPKEKFHEAFKTRAAPSATHGASKLFIAQMLNNIKQNKPPPTHDEMA